MPVLLLCSSLCASYVVIVILIDRVVQCFAYPVCAVDVRSLDVVVFVVFHQHFYICGVDVVYIAGQLIACFNIGVLVYVFGSSAKGYRIFDIQSC